MLVLTRTVGHGTDGARIVVKVPPSETEQEIIVELKQVRTMKTARIGIIADKSVEIRRAER